MNNHGQLGIGNKKNTETPTRSSDLDPYEGDYVTQITGGEHHSIALMASGCTYSFGCNTEGQIGIGDLFGDH